VVVKLDALLREKNIPMITVRAYGLVGAVRVSMEEHCVVEAKPDNRVDDLRLGTPWPELASFAEGIKTAELDSHARKHVPWGVLLVQAARAWRDAHGGALPATAAERKQMREQVHLLPHFILVPPAVIRNTVAVCALNGFNTEPRHQPYEPLSRRVSRLRSPVSKALVKRCPELTREGCERFQRATLVRTGRQALEWRRRALGDGTVQVAALKTGLEDEENVGEALANLHKVWSTPPISAELKMVLADARATVMEGSSEFWVLVAALGRFVDAEGVLPLDGALPDMTASTELYLELQARLTLFPSRRHVPECMRGGRMICVRIDIERKGSTPSAACCPFVC
jgi:hypothetical protein